MTLIVCPHCNKKVSDTQKNCIHCGKPLFEETEKKIETENKETLTDYAELPVEKKEELEKEFAQTKDAYVKFKKRQKDMPKLRGWAYYGLIYLLIYRLMVNKIYDNVVNESLLYAGMYVMIAVLVITWGVALFTLIISKSMKKKNLIFLKHYQEWLKEKKEINYTVKFSVNERWQREFFNNIDLNYVDL